VWAECLFADPIGDIAVLGPPDNQELSDEYEAYEGLLEKFVPLPISDPLPRVRLQAWLLSLKGRWFPCIMQHGGGPLWITEAVNGIIGGMSGSPILADDGSAVGVICCGGGNVGHMHTEGGPNPRLAYNLPAGFLRDLGCSGLFRADHRERAQSVGH
jgi:hypothetical protein